MSTIEVCWRGDDVLVEFDYQPAEKGDFYTPPVDEDVDFNQVFMNGDEVLNAFSRRERQELKQLVLNQIHDDAEAEAYADMDADR